MGLYMRVLTTSGTYFKLDLKWQLIWITCYANYSKSLQSLNLVVSSPAQISLRRSWNILTTSLASIA